MNFKKASILLGALLTITILFAACSSNKDVTSADDNSLQRVIDAGKLTVVGSGGYPPFNYFDENGDVVGFDVDVGNEIAKRLGVKLD